VGPHQVIGASGVIRNLMTECASIAACRSKVLITGESGVGKEIFARYIHSCSQRKHAPMITINCAGVPESLLESELFGHLRGSFTDAHRDRRGLLEAAHRGTAFLDEIGEMGARMQTLLLRFLETGEIHRVGADQPGRPLDVRLIAATNRDLWAETQKGTFRLDLYYRLNVVHVFIPPLRDRREDIMPLLLHFLELTSSLEGRPMPQLTAEAVGDLERYSWPGNVRELKNVAERLVVGFGGRSVSRRELSAEIVPADITSKPAISPGPAQRVIDNCFERMTIGGESFWTVVYQPFISRDLTREALRAILRRGLEQTHGSYPIVASLFNLANHDYRKFMRVLHKHDCHMPVQPFRMLRHHADPVPAGHGLDRAADRLSRPRAQRHRAVDVSRIEAVNGEVAGFDLDAHLHTPRRDVAIADAQLRHSNAGDRD
jgi:DNA-binding NtrC family response regulator